MKRPNASRTGERGSAFVIALLVLVILTILGLSLAFITSGEVEVAKNERQINRVFYTADSGVAVAAARAMFNIGTPVDVDFTDKAGLPTAGVRNTTSLPAAVLINQTLCDLCSVGNDIEYGDVVYKKVTRVLTSEAKRVDDAKSAVLGRKKVVATLEMLPMQESVAPALEINALDNNELSRVGPP